MAHASTASATPPAPHYETLYILTEEDAYMVAKDMGVTITKDDMRSIKKGIDGGIGSIWMEVMRLAIENAIEQRQ